MGYFANGMHPFAKNPLKSVSNQKGDVLNLFDWRKWVQQVEGLTFFTVNMLNCVIKPEITMWLSGTSSKIITRTHLRFKTQFTLYQPQNKTWTKMAENPKQLPLWPNKGLCLNVMICASKRDANSNIFY